MSSIQTTQYMPRQIIACRGRYYQILRRSSLKFEAPHYGAGRLLQEEGSNSHAIDPAQEPHHNCWIYNVISATDSQDTRLAPHGVSPFRRRWVESTRAAPAFMNINQLGVTHVWIFHTRECAPRSRWRTGKSAPARLNAYPGLKMMVDLACKGEVCSRFRKCSDHRGKAG